MAVKKVRIMGARGGKVLAGFVTVAILLLLFPILVLAIFSFNADRFPSMPWRGTTVKWYRDALANRDLISAIKLSLESSLVTTLASLVFGSSAAWGLMRVRTSASIALAAVFALPFLVPQLILGLSVRMAFTEIGVMSASLRLIATHTLVFSPLVFALVYANLIGLSRQLEPVAQDLGCDLVQTIWRVHIPLVSPVLAGTALLVFGLVWDEFILAWMLLDVDTTLPVRIWSMMEASVSPEINAVGTMTVAFTLPLFALGLWLLMKRPRVF